MDGKPPPKVPEPLFPVLRRLGVADVQRARSWLLAWLLDRLGQRVQEPPAASYAVEHQVDGRWGLAIGPFYRRWAAVQIARELNRLGLHDRYRVVGPEGVVDLDDPTHARGEFPHGT